MNPNEQNCDQFEPMVSALIDNELSPDEHSILNDHLDQCDSCRQLMRDFESVNSSVDSLSFAPSVDRANSQLETFVVTRQKQSLNNWLSVWRLVPLAGVASLLIGLLLVTAQPAPEATAEQLTLEQFVKPMTDLNRINHQQQRDQELMLRTLGMDLRSLKLELIQLENAGPEDRTRFENQIEEMLSRVEQFETR
jgi:hypothetical protein